ncbi:MAG: hypothetical protein GY731_02260, partial [Gammaproteobacteria bacterium]|nr:hypothetical protein [Gammaproteobacteria bacterium]
LQVNAGIKCWTNKDGVRECGKVIPPEYVQKGYIERSNSGAGEKKIRRAKTAAEMEQERLNNQKKAEEEARLAEKKRIADIRREKRLRQDRVFLNTYTSEDELKLTLDSRIGAIQSSIKLKQSQTAKRETILKELEGRAITGERGGKGVPDKLKKEIKRVQHQIEKNLRFIKKRDDEQKMLTMKYEKDAARFRALKSGKINPGDVDNTIPN